MSNQLAVFAPKSYNELGWIAERLSKTGMIPAQYKNKPDDCFAAIMMGAELGVSAMQALQGIAVINGRPAVWGDLMMAVCRAHDSCESICEGNESDEKGILLWWCTAKRKGNPEQTRKFSRDDAAKANLWGKACPCTQYPSRMLQMRARAFCLRDVFSDALKGIASADEVQDMPQERYTDDAPAKVTAKVETARIEAPSRECPADHFEKQLAAVWGPGIAGGKPADKVIAQLSSKYDFTPDQLAKINAYTPKVEVEGEAQ